MTTPENSGLHLTFYPHFDEHISLDKVNAIVTDPEKVARHAFFPFLEYTKKQTKFGSPHKERKIRYTSRLSLYIFKYYRKLISEKYEKALIENHLQEYPQAYRKIIDTESKNKTSKSNIHFAKEAFTEISRRGPCFALCLDISSFFDNIDHKNLYKLWCNLLEVEELPKDHHALFRVITNYTVIDRDDCYVRLGYMTETVLNGKSQKKFTHPDRRIPMQLCSPKVFREKICSGPNKLTQKNKQNHGLPQGVPISDLLANLYLFNFDKAISLLEKKLGGYYRRYSDDILFICPNKEQIPIIINAIKTELQLAGEKLKLNDKKTQITEFYADGTNSQKPMEYLGFSFDGQKALIKNATLSGYFRNMKYETRQQALALIKEFPHKTLTELLEIGQKRFPDIYQKYGNIEGFDESSDDSKPRNFRSYAIKASRIMKDIGGQRILHQLRDTKKRLKKSLEHEIRKAFAAFTQ